MLQVKVLTEGLEVTSTGEDRFGSVVSGSLKLSSSSLRHNFHSTSLSSVNFLLTEALERYYFYYGETLKVECPTGSGNKMNLLQVSQELCRRIVNLFAPDKDGRRACHGNDPRYASDPHWKDLVLFYEYFNGDTGKGCGARWVVQMHTKTAAILFPFANILSMPLPYIQPQNRVDCSSIKIHRQAVKEQTSSNSVTTVKRLYI